MGMLKYVGENLRVLEGYVYGENGVGTGVTHAGAVSDADFAETPDNGMLGVDTTNSRLYIRVGGTWKYAALT